VEAWFPGFLFIVAGLSLIGRAVTPDDASWLLTPYRASRQKRIWSFVGGVVAVVIGVLRLLRDLE
jgi:hypothetical protein